MFGKRSQWIEAKSATKEQLNSPYLVNLRPFKASGLLEGPQNVVFWASP